jgi:hypothetical protein
MRLTLYRTRLAHVPAYAHVHDYTVRDRADPVGRLYQVRSSARPELAWSWLITVYVDPRAEVRTSGTADDLAEAKAAFRTSWLEWLNWKRRELSTTKLWFWDLPGDRGEVIPRRASPAPAPFAGY